MARFLLLALALALEGGLLGDVLLTLALVPHDLVLLHRVQAVVDEDPDASFDGAVELARDGVGHMRRGAVPKPVGDAK